MNKLTDKGIVRIGEETYEVENISFPEKEAEKPHYQPLKQHSESPPPAKIPLKEAKKRFNESDHAKEYGLRLVSKSTIFLLWVGMILFLIAFVSLGAWANYTFENKDFSSSFSDNSQTFLNNTLNTPIQVNNSNQHTIVVQNYNNNTILFPEELINVLINSS